MDRIKIGIYVFANTAYFFEKLIKLNDKIDWYVVLQRYHHKERFLNILDKEKILYLYEDFKINNINIIYDNATIANIYKTLEIDKNGYRNIEKDKQLELIKSIYFKYKKFLLNLNLDYLIFPDLEVVDGIVLLNLCYELNVIPLYTVHMRQFGVSFFSSYIDERLPRYFGDYDDKNIEKATYLVEDFFSLSSKNFIRNYRESDKYKITVPSLLSRILRNICIKLKYEKYYYGEDNFLLKIKANLVYYLEKYRQTKYNYYHKKFFDIKSNDEIDKLPKNFILFALQVTPESSINSLEPYFIDQLRAIDLIRLNMPNDFYIVVKEHPSMRGIRNTDFYKQLRKKAGVILVGAEVNTKEIMKKAKLISTITGTIALEAFMMDKPALMFGPSFFSHLVYRYDSYLNFKEDLRKMIFEHKPMSKEEKIIEIAKLYNIGYSTMLFDPIANPEVMEKGNIENFYKAVMDHIERLKNV